MGLSAIGKIVANDNVLATLLDHNIQDFSFTVSACYDVQSAA